MRRKRESQAYLSRRSRAPDQPSCSSNRPGFVKAQSEPSTWTSPISVLFTLATDADGSGGDIVVAGGGSFKASREKC